MKNTVEPDYVDDETGAPEVPPTIEPTPPAAKTPEPEPREYVAPALIDVLNAHAAKIGIQYEVSSVPGKGKRLDQIGEDGTIKRLLSPATGAEISAWIKGALHMIG